ncbi:MAG TPA: GNAT family N-acetyltransferase [Flavobacteriaceae bacterium]|nr:GNAT family N-acetyltransferase [Flavobacteriaceae bacterium]
MEYKVIEVPVEEILPIRSAELREGLDPEQCRFEEDEDEGTVHFGLYINGEIIGCLTVLRKQHDKFDAPNQHQYRGMAISKAYQGNSLGNLLLNKADWMVLERKASFIWIHARKLAVNFYRRNGYSVVGSTFDIPGIGEHYLMYKRL